jgi:DNA-binding NtrC family response regulator
MEAALEKIPRILVVDDEVSICSSLVNFFEDLGYSSVYKLDADSAIEYLKANTVDIMIVDMRLGKTDGNTLILEANKIQPDIFFIIYTGSVDYTLPDSLKRLGISKEVVFKKPVTDLSVFLETIQKVTAQQD